jgi:hypothetical protein
MQDDSTLSPLQSFFRNKWVRLCLIFDALLLLVLIGVLIWQSTKVSTIDFDITPLDSAISINGKQYTNGQYSITPGSYKVTITHEGLEAKTFDINISPQNSVSVSTFLSDEEKTFDFYQQRANYMSYKKLEEIASSNNNITTDHDTSAESFIARFQEDYEAFTTKLPIDYYESKGYGQTLEILKTINILAKDDCKYILCVQALIVGTNDQEFIKSLLKEKGINAEDFEIEYKYY